MPMNRATAEDLCAITKAGAAAVALVVLPLFLVSPAFSQTSAAARSSRDLITEQVDANKFVTMRGSVHPAATAANDRGRVDDAMPLEHMFLQLHRSAEQERALTELINELHDPSSPNFHHWLTPDQIGSRFGPSERDIAAISGWLQSQGLKVNGVYPNRMTIDFSGTAGTVSNAFRTEIHHLSVNGQSHFANMTIPQIPSALAPAVSGIVALHDFRPHAMHRARPQYTETVNKSTQQLVVPADLATIYNFNPVFNAGITGAGQTIVVLEDTNVDTADWNTFRKAFGLSGYTTGSISVAHPAPAFGDNCFDPGIVYGEDSEAAIDAEWASAAAPGATIQVASCADYTNFGALIALQNLLSNRNPPAIVSLSYGLCETVGGPTWNESFSTAYQTAAAAGVSVFVSAGDAGAADCDEFTVDATHGIGVNGLASTAYNVAVGGTDFGDSYAGTNSTYWSSTNSATYGSAKSYIPEIPWNDTCASLLIYSSYGFSSAAGTHGFCNSNNIVKTFPLAFFGGYLNTGAGGGGPSNCATGYGPTGVAGIACMGTGWPKPAWQSGVTGIPNDGVRDLPDISLFSGDGVWGHWYAVCYSDRAGGGFPCTGAPSNWYAAGGTSFATPILAGIQALVNQKTGSIWGNPNTVYYKLAASSSNVCDSSDGSASGCIFYDITQGDIDIPCTGTFSCYGSTSKTTEIVGRKRSLISFGVLSTSSSSLSQAYSATPGWDFATGLGSVNVANLVNNWSSGVATATVEPRR